MKSFDQDNAPDADIPFLVSDNNSYSGARVHLRDTDLVILPSNPAANFKRKIGFIKYHFNGRTIRKRPFHTPIQWSESEIRTYLMRELQTKWKAEFKGIPDVEIPQFKNYDAAYDWMAIHHQPTAVKFRELIQKVETDLKKIYSALAKKRVQTHMGLGTYYSRLKGYQ